MSLDYQSAVLKKQKPWTTKLIEAFPTLKDEQRYGEMRAMREIP